MAQQTLTIHITDAKSMHVGDLDEDNEIKLTLNRNTNAITLYLNAQDIDSIHKHLQYIKDQIIIKRNKQ
jgi:hypothetical protein